MIDRPPRQDKGYRQTMGADNTDAERKAQAERYRNVMWAYVCGAITLLSSMVGLGATYIPLGFGILGGILAWNLTRSGDQRHGMFAGMLLLGGLMIWLTYNWPTIQRFVSR
jgi:hypothetical protein